MKLVIVTSSSPGNQVHRITTESSLEEVVALLGALGVEDWEIYSKGRVALEADTQDLFVAIGPEKASDAKSFMKALKGISLTGPPLHVSD